MYEVQADCTQTFSKSCQYGWGRVDERCHCGACWCWLGARSNYQSTQHDIARRLSSYLRVDFWAFTWAEWRWVIVRKLIDFCKEGQYLLFIVRVDFNLAKLTYEFNINLGSMLSQKLNRWIKTVLINF